MLNKVLSAYKTLGIVFVCLVLLAVWLTYAIFTKQFSDYEEVRLRTSTIGLQLPSRADVKVRGVIVGEVLEMESLGADGAELTLGIYPDKIGTVPANVTGSIVPKTLFGEKYVSLVVPESGPSGTIQAGATIERTQVATEIEEVLADLYPLLRTVQPADLNLTLNAVATALEGRGEALGQNLETLDSYLKRINPEIPLLLQDLRLTAEVSDTYADILPDVAQILDNTITTTQTLEEKEVVLNTALRDITAFSDTARVFLAENADRLETAGIISTRILAVLDRYAPEIPCLAKGLDRFAPRMADAFRGNTLHIVLELLPTQPRSYGVQDLPFFGEDRGYSCADLPNPPWTQENPLRSIPNFADGVEQPTGKGTRRVAPSYSDPLAYHGAPDDVATLQALLEQRYGAGTDPSLGVLYAGPIVTGAGER